MRNLINIRHQLHQIAEPSGEETKTQAFILEILKTLSPDAIHTFDNSRSILAVYDSGKAGKTLLFRGDFDAVRVNECLDIPYRSCTSGVSHKCGHDGHTAILLGLAEQLHLNPPHSGRILLFFQAAEETGEGAQELLDTHILDTYFPNQIFALHNIPGMPLGTILCRKDSFTCSVISCDIALHGRTSHAAEPLKALSPYPAAKRITDKLLSFNQYDISRDDFFLLTLVEFRVGEPAYGVTAGEGVLRFTLRAKDDALLQERRKELIQICEMCAAHDGLTTEIGWREYFAATKNHEDAVRRIQAAAEQCGLTYNHLPVPFSWGEDFGLLTQQYEGALFGLGSGTEQSPLHHPDFDFPDELIDTGVKIFYQLTTN